MLATQKYLVAYNRIMETSFFQLLFIQELIRIKPISIELLFINADELITATDKLRFVKVLKIAIATLNSNNYRFEL